MSLIPRSHLIGISVISIVLIGLPTILPSGLENPIAQYGTGIILSVGPLLLISVACIRRYGNPLKTNTSNLQRDIFTVWGGLLCLWSLAGITSYIILQMGQKAANQSAPEAASQSFTTFVIVLVGSAILVAPIEELFFRGVIHGYLSERYEIILAIIVSSIFFSFAHIWTVTGTNTGKMLYLTFLFSQGVVYAVVYEYTDSIYAVVGLHALYNVTIKLLAM